MAARWKFWQRGQNNPNDPDAPDAPIVPLDAEGLKVKQSLLEQLNQEKIRTQEKRLKQQMELSALKSKRRKLQYDLKLKLSSTPWNTAEYHKVLKLAFQRSGTPFPTDDTYLNEAVKVLKQEHKTMLHDSLSKLVSSQGNEELMRILGSIPNIKDEFNGREESVCAVVGSTVNENTQLKNVLHYKCYILEKMKDKYEIADKTLQMKLRVMQSLSSIESIDDNQEDINNSDEGIHEGYTFVTNQGKVNDDEESRGDNKRLQRRSSSTLSSVKSIDEPISKASDDNIPSPDNDQSSDQQQHSQEQSEPQHKSEGGYDLEDTHLPLNDTYKPQSTTGDDDEKSTTSRNSKASQSERRQKAQQARQQLEKRRKARGKPVPERTRSPVRARTAGSPVRARITARSPGRSRRNPLSEFSHLKEIHQPKVDLEDDNKSLDDDQLFDEPSAKVEKPLVAAAKKAQEQQLDRQQKAEQTRTRLEERRMQRQREQKSPLRNRSPTRNKASPSYSHLKKMNQSKKNDDDDNKSLDDHHLFDTPSPKVEKPLLGAAKKTKEQQKGKMKSPPSPLRSKKRQVEQSEARQRLEEKKLELQSKALNAPSSPYSRSKPQISGARQRLEAQKQQQQKELAKENMIGNIEIIQSNSSPEPKHLENMNQPKSRADDDNKSLDDDELFLPNSNGAPPERPLVEAAKKAKTKMARKRLEEIRRQRDAVAASDGSTAGQQAKQRLEERRNRRSGRPAGRRGVNRTHSNQSTDSQDSYVSKESSGSIGSGSAHGKSRSSRSGRTGMSAIERSRARRAQLIARNDSNSATSSSHTNTSASKPRPTPTTST